MKKSHLTKKKPLDSRVSKFFQIKKRFKILAPTYSCPIGLPSAMEVLTTVFEMGTGVAPPEEAPEFWNVLLFTQNISFIFFHGCRARPISTARLNALLRLH